MTAISYTAIGAFLWANRKPLMAIALNAPALIAQANDLRKSDGTPEAGEAKKRHVFETMRKMTPAEVPDSFINFGIELALQIVRWTAQGGRRGPTPIKQKPSDASGTEPAE